MHISVGYGPVLWGVDYYNDAWYKILGAPKWDERVTEEDWIDVGAKMVYLDVGRDGHVWALDSTHSLFWREGITPELREGTDFIKQEYSTASYGNFIGVAICTNGDVWAVTTDGELYYKDGVDYDDNRPMGQNTWTIDNSAYAQDKRAAQITCGANGDFSMVTEDGQIWTKAGVSYADPMGMEAGWHEDSSMVFSQVALGEQGQ